MAEADEHALPESLHDVTVAAAAAVSVLSVAVFGRARQEGRARRLGDERFDRTWALVVLFGIAGLVATLATDSDDPVALLVGVGSGVVLLVSTLLGAVRQR